MLRSQNKDERLENIVDQSLMQTKILDRDVQESLIKQKLNSDLIQHILFARDNHV